MKKVLVTGITGFVGSHLAEYILENHKEYKVYGLCRWRSPKENLKNIINDITLLEGDLLDRDSLDKVLAGMLFDIIFHLAAQSYVQSSFKSAVSTLNTNIIGTANLLDSIKAYCNNDPLIHLASSSEVYGEVAKEDQPTTEQAPLKPASPYAVSKVGTDMLGYQYFLSYDMPIIRTRAFSHSGARRGDVFVLSAFAKQIVAIELGLKTDSIKVGNLDSSRTFCDVRDMVRAYWLVITKGKAGEVYNIGGTEETTIKYCLDRLIEISIVNHKIEVDPKLYRPSDVTSQIPCTDKFRKLTGWKPEYSLDDILLSILEYWREELKINHYKVLDVK